MIHQIIEEIEYYNSTEFETFELRNFIHYFQFYLIYYKFNTISVFFFINQEYFSHIINIFKEDIEKENFDNYISKIHSLSIFLNNIPENLTESSNLIINSVIKELLINKMSYYRIDVRLAVENIFK